MRTITLLITILSLSLPAYAQYSGGTGEPNDPYQIATAEDLMLLGDNPEDYDKHFILTDDIDLDPNLPDRKVFDRAVIAPDTDSSQDFQGTVFGGVFDGNDHIISNLTIDTAGVDNDYLALFGEIRGENAEVKNISVVNHKIISGDSHPEFLGGLIGRNFNGSISNCCAIGSITGGDSAENFGGLCGHNDFGTISDCYAAGSVTAGSVTGSGCDYLGGLCGESFGNIINCYATTTVVGKGESWNLGGLCGGNTGTISNCYAKGSVISNNNDSVYLGGLCGENSGYINDCFAAGEVADGNGSNYVGGLCGKNNINGYISNCFWDILTSGQTTSDGGTGKTTSEMQTASTFLEAGWDFMDETDNGTEDIWKISEGLDYPRLWWEKYSGGTGEPDDPYQIATAEDLMLLGESPDDYDKHFILTADIDLDPNLPGGRVFDSAVIAPITMAWEMDPKEVVRLKSKGVPFAGVFDGNGHKISHLTVRDDRYVGLFGQVGSTAEVVDLGLEGINIIGASGKIWQGVLGVFVKSRHVGGLVGHNSGYLNRCYSIGSVSGDRDYVGGLVGHNRGYVICCYSTCAVIGDLGVGGLVGYNQAGTVAQCYSAGVVSGNLQTGGLVGYNSRTVDACFWDTQASTLTGSAGGTGKTTSEMQTVNTFLDTGWDFVGETANGPNDIWKMWDGYDYPRLAWEPGPNTLLVFVDINDPGFYGQMSKYEVTNAQYCDFLNAALASGDITVNGTDVEGASGSNSGADYVGQRYYRGDGSGYTGYGATNGGASRIHYNEGAFNVDNGFGNHPVTYVSWYGAMAFANYYGYYLPTEDQWQAVADYDGTYIYGCGETIDPGIANYRNSEHPDGTTSVGSFGIYGYGMSDMAGNVWEWASSSLGSSRIFRGGSLGSVDSDCAVSIRGDGIPYANYYDIGFRVCH